MTCPANFTCQIQGVWLSAFQVGVNRWTFPQDYLAAGLSLMCAGQLGTCKSAECNL